MKRIIFVLILVVLLPISAHSQGPFTGFFKPTNRVLKFDKSRADFAQDVWLFRPTIAVTAMQFFIESPVQVASLSQLGTGLSYARYTAKPDGTPYESFGANFLVLFSQDLAGVEPTKLSFAITGTAFQYVSIGGGYSLGDKKFFILTGITYSF